MRRLSLYCVFALSITACGGQTATVTVHDKATPDYARQDGRDPNRSGCSSPMLIDSNIVTNVAGTSVAVRAPDRRRLGTLVLRRSAKMDCHTMWARVDDLPPRPPRGYVIHLTVVRPGDGRRVAYQTRNVAVAAYGNMLTYERGCVRAEAFLSRRGKDGPTARTSCQK